MSMTSNFRASMLAILMALPVAGVTALIWSGEAFAQATAGGWRKELADRLCNGAVGLSGQTRCSA